VEAPPLWPWIVLGLPFVLSTALLVLRRDISLVRVAAIALGVTAALAMLVTGAGFALSSYASGGKWVEAVNELVFALVGIAFVVWASREARPIAGGALGFLGLGVGLSKVPVLLHGAVLSVLPGTIARLAVVLAISAGAAPAVLGLLLFGEALEHGIDDESL
jgi:hypothetical protein